MSKDKKIMGRVACCRLVHLVYNRIKFAFSIGRKILTAYDLASPVVKVYGLQNVNNIGIIDTTLLFLI